jgi:metal-sulfur cluster biosynthetic enzyme
MGIGNMIGRLLNNESKAEKDERLHLSSEKEASASKGSVVENKVNQVAANQGEHVNNTSTKSPEPANKPSSSEAGGKVTEEKILEVLSEVYDPEIPIDIVNLGLIYGIGIEEGKVLISMTMTAPGCPASAQIAGESKLVVEEIPGVDSVDIDIVWDPPWDPSKMSEEAQQSMGMI